MKWPRNFPVMGGATAIAAIALAGVGTSMAWEGKPRPYIVTFIAEIKDSPHLQRDSALREAIIQ